MRLSGFPNSGVLTQTLKTTLQTKATALLKGKPPLFKLVQKQLLLEIIRHLFGRLKMIATFPRKLTQESFLIFPGKSGNNNGTGRSERIRWQRNLQKSAFSRPKAIIISPN